jgi:hypothetical protein
MKYIDTDKSFGGIKKYIKTNDELKIGPAELKSILYSFWKDKFFGVYINCEGYVNCSNLKEVVFEKFGKGYKSNRFIEEYILAGNIASVYFKYQEIPKQGVLVITSDELANEARKYEEQKVKEGALKGF